MFDVVIIGTGPAGLMAGIVASKKGRKVLFIERNEYIAKKLAITGGGRCNVTNMKRVDLFCKELPVNNKSLINVLHKFSPQHIYDFFESTGVPMKIEDNDRAFPLDNNSKSIIDALYSQLNMSNVTLKLNEVVKDIVVSEDAFNIITNNHKYLSKKLIIATGGCTYPQTGSTGDGYSFAKSLGHSVTELYPSETFLVSSEKFGLEGITLENVVVEFGKKKANGALLFTHSGISGPAVFRISSEVYKEINKINNSVNIYVDLVPKMNQAQLLEFYNKYPKNKEILNFVREFVPRRVAEFILQDIDFKTQIAHVSKVKSLALISKLKKMPINILRTGKMEQSFVTGGGVSLKDIDMKTMESKICKGLYFAGEVLDVHGHTGGYNITIALSTGYVAGNEV